MDPAQALNDLIVRYCSSDYGRQTVSPEGLRRLIRERWPTVKTLAHAIHDSENVKTVPFQRETKPANPDANGRVAFVRRGADVDKVALAGAGYSVVIVSDVERDVRLA
jgi:hypothetical protein